jgi:glycosyltransferase involved in cell wall biosynthesis
VDLATVIVAVHNEEKHLDDCLRSLVEQRHVRHEVIVVDDGSTDRTPAIAQSYVERYFHFRLLRQDHLGWTYGRNLGAEHARGEVLVFADGDMTFAPDYVYRLIEPILQGKAVGTFSKEERVANYDNVWARSWNLHDGLYGDRRHPPDFPNEHCSFRAVSRAVFLRVGGYGHLGAGSDHTLADRLGALASVAPGAVCYHYNPSTLSEVFFQARWYARGARIPRTWRNFLLHTPPFSILRSLKRAIRFHLPQFVIFKMVYDAGVMAGMVWATLAPQKHGR